VQAGRWSCSGGSDGGESESSAYPADEHCRSTDALDYRQTERPHRNKSPRLPEPGCWFAGDRTLFKLLSLGPLQSLDLQEEKGKRNA